MTEPDALPPPSEQDREMHLIDHLVELRSRLLYCVLMLLLVALALLPFSAQLHTWFVLPLQQALPQPTQLIATGTISPFFTPFKLALYAALGITMPFFLFQIWAFIAPGLYRHEKNLYGAILLASIVMFYAGMLFVYGAVFPLLYQFMASIQLPGVTWMPDISDNLDLMFKLFFAFGIAFEVPVVTFVLVRAGIASLDTLKSARRYVIVLCFAIAMVLTPPDVLSQCLMAIPMCLLYEVGLLFARWFPGRDAPHDDA
jgi:sec-independent protein translocase protein TatC